MEDIFLGYAIVAKRNGENGLDRINQRLGRVQKYKEKVSCGKKGLHLPCRAAVGPFYQGNEARNRTTLLFKGVGERECVNVDVIITQPREKKKRKDVSKYVNKEA